MSYLYFCQGSSFERLDAFLPCGRTEWMDGQMDDNWTEGRMDKQMDSQM